MREKVAKPCMTMLAPGRQMALAGLVQEVCSRPQEADRAEMQPGAAQEPTRHLVIIGDSRQMPELQSESVHLVVPSPPYWCIKDYEHPGQIGAGQSYEQYLEDLGKVLGEAARVLHCGCRMAINIGDQFLRASEHGRYRVQPLGADVINIGRRLGLDYMGAIIWRKITTTVTTGGGCWMGSTYYPRDGHITYEHEYIVLLKKPGRPPGPPSPEAKMLSRLTKEQRSAWFRGIWDDLPPVRQEPHQAMFPVGLPSRLIRMYTFWGETVLDPFLGSGTTCIAAALEGRNSIGYEINPAFEALIRQRWQAEIIEPGQTP
ncbi:MAG: site-specific DNA-methyltransferase, partial [Armatimonadetes bacterium]|nr:site-specific DNA-methyltransferase [Armatimonadota bacterium]